MKLLSFLLPILMIWSITRHIQAVNVGNAFFTFVSMPQAVFLCCLCSKAEKIEKKRPRTFSTGPLSKIKSGNRLIQLLICKVLVD